MMDFKIWKGTNTAATFVSLFTSNLALFHCYCLVTLVRKITKTNSEKASANVFFCCSPRLIKSNFPNWWPGVSPSCWYLTFHRQRFGFPIRKPTVCNWLTTKSLEIVRVFFQLRYSIFRISPAACERLGMLNVFRQQYNRSAQEVIYSAAGFGSFRSSHTHDFDQIQNAEGEIPPANRSLWRLRSWWSILGEHQPGHPSLRRLLFGAPQSGQAHLHCEVSTPG